MHGRLPATGAAGSVTPARNHSTGAGRQARPLSFQPVARQRQQSTGLLLLAVVALLASPSVASADGTGRGRLFVPGDHFDPGATLAISGTELDPGAELILRLVNGSTTAELGRATVADDRTFAATATVPVGFPTGYSELTATDPGGSTWSTFILIGDRPEGPRPDATSPDEQTIALVALGLGIIVFLVAGASFLRGRVRPSSRG